eukprot:jgi/Chlat1/5920/Chrsp4S00499
MLTGAATSYNELLKEAGKAQFVLIGRGSHGTHDFYSERNIITRRLIEEHGFRAIALEADWPDAYAINRFVRGVDNSMTVAAEALSSLSYSAALEHAQEISSLDVAPRQHVGFRWVVALIQYVAYGKIWNGHAGGRYGPDLVGVYGLDLYCMREAMQDVLRFLAKEDHELFEQARQRYTCFDTFRSEQWYGLAASLGCANCEQHVWDMLNDMLKKKCEIVSKAHRDQNELADDYFYAEQSALVVADSEKYYRAMFLAQDDSWNVRESHMMKILDALIEYLNQKRSEEGTKVVVWTHNSHAGDARATDWMRAPGCEFSLDQLVREKHGSDKAYLVGQITFTGTVTAALEWGDPPERVQVMPCREDSYEHLFYQSGLPAFWLNFKDENEAKEMLDEEYRFMRYIGVVYSTERDRLHHYYGRGQVTKQFDALVYYESTRAVEPLDHDAGEAIEEVLQTTPEGR